MTSAGERAMALVDGQLAPAEVPRLVQELARSAALVAELQGYLALSQSRIANVYAGKAEEPVSARLIDLVRDGAPIPPRTPAPVHRENPLLRWLGGRCQVPAWSLAATPVLAAAVAFALAFVTQPRAPSYAHFVEAGLTSALEKSESGTDAAVATVRPMLSFRAKTAGWCRQYEVRNQNRQVSHGLACRGGDGGGDWKVVASTAAATGGYMPAGGGRRQVIDDLAATMMRGQPLTQAEETVAIASGWGRL